MKIVPANETIELPKLSKTELIQLVEKISSVEGSEAEIDRMIEIFEHNVPHPAGSDLLFWPEKSGCSAEEIVEEALSYKPILL